MIFDRMLYPALMAIYSSSHTFHYDFAYMWCIVYSQLNIVQYVCMQVYSGITAVAVFIAIIYEKTLLHRLCLSMFSYYKIYLPW